MMPGSYSERCSLMQASGLLPPVAERHPAVIVCLFRSPRQSGSTSTPALHTLYIPYEYRYSRVMNRCGRALPYVDPTALNSLVSRTVSTYIDGYGTLLVRYRYPYALHMHPHPCALCESDPAGLLSLHLRFRMSECHSSLF